MARTWPNNSANRLAVSAGSGALALPENGSKFTLACWIKLNSNGAADQTFMSKYDGSKGPLMRSLSGKLRMFWIDSGPLSGHEAIGATTMSTGVWYHCAATWPKSTSPGMQVWLNGAVDGADTTNGTMNATAQTNWTFGARSAPSNPLDGDACEFCIFNDVLTADQIAALAKGISPYRVAPNLLVGYWPTFSSSDSGVDYSKNSNLASLTGTLVTANHAPVSPQVPRPHHEWIEWEHTTSTNPPVNTVAPAVTPSWPEVGRLVSCDGGTWTGTPTPTLTYQWQYSADGSTGWTNIGGATSATYRIASTYNTKYLRCVVTGTNSDPGSPSTANSNVVGPVTASPSSGQAVAVAVS